MAKFQLFFQSTEQVVFVRAQIRIIGWVIKTLDAQVGQFLLGWNSSGFFLSKYPSIALQKWVILRVNSLAFWKIINGRMPSWSQNIEARTFPAYSCTRNFWGVVSRYDATPLTVALSPGNSDITRFRSWSKIATGINLYRAEKIPKFLQTTVTVGVFDPRSGILGRNLRRASACPNLHEW